MKNVKRLDKKQLCDIFMEVAIQIYCLFPWMQSEDGKMNVLMYLIRDVRAEDHEDWYRSVFLPNVERLPEDAAAIPAFLRFIFILVVAMQIVSLIYGFASVKKKYIVDFLGRIRLMVLMVIFLGSGLLMDLGWLSDAVTAEGELIIVIPVSVALYLFMLAALVGAWMVLGRMFESWDAAALRVKMEREQRRLYKKERKKRLYFAGRYPRLYYEILWKDFKKRRKSFLFLVFSVFLSALFLFSGIGMRSIFSESYAEANSGVLGLGLLEIMQDFLLVITIVSIFLITIVLSSYWKKRLESMGLFNILGIRRDALFKEWMGEMAICFSGAVSGGLLAGKFFLCLLKVLIRSAVPAIGDMGNAGLGVYGGTILGMLIIFSFAYGFSHDMQTARSSQDIRGMLVQSEGIPGKRRLLWTGMGCVAAVYCLQRYAQRRTAESIVVLSIFLLSVFIIVCYIWGARLQDMKKKISRYLYALPKVHMVRHRYKTTIKYVCLLTMLHVYFMFFFLMRVVSNVIATKPEALFPYDYVLLANSSDEALITELTDTCDAQIWTFPMVRATTIDNTEEIERPDIIIWQQGQNIGISETTYRELKALIGEDADESLKLDDKGESIYIVYQQDQAGKVKPLDWYMMTKLPYLHIGQPLFAYDTHNYQKYYPQRMISGEERKSVIGCFKQGKYENLVVFSDAYFEQVKDYWKVTDMYTGETVSENDTDQEEMELGIYEGPTRLVLVNVPKGYRERAGEIVTRFREIHQYDESLDPLVDSAYSKEEAIQRRQMEHVLEILVNGFICVLLFMVSLLLLYIKTETELPEMKERYKLLKHLGMRRKERIQTEKKEISRFVAIPLGLAVPVVLIFTGIVLWMRDFSGKDIAAYGIYGGGICLIYILLQLTVMKYLQHKAVRHIEKELS